MFTLSISNFCVFYLRDYLWINVWENRRGNQTMDNPEKLATVGTCVKYAVLSVVFCIVFYWLLFVLLSFFDLQILITPLVSSIERVFRTIEIIFAWVSSCCLTLSKQLFNSIIVRTSCFLYKTNMWSCIFIVLVQWNNIPQVIPNTSPPVSFSLMLFP